MKKVSIAFLFIFPLMTLFACQKGPADPLLPDIHNDYYYAGFAEIEHNFYATHGISIRKSFYGSFDDLYNNPWTGPAVSPIINLYLYSGVSENEIDELVTAKATLKILNNDDVLYEEVITVEDFFNYSLHGYKIGKEDYYADGHVYRYKFTRPEASTFVFESIPFDSLSDGLYEIQLSFKLIDENGGIFGISIKNGEVVKESWVSEGLFSITGRILLFAGMDRLY